MSSRYTRSGLRAVVVVLPVLLPMLLALGAHAADSVAGASTSSAPVLTLLHQSPEVLQPGSGPLSLELGIGPSVPTGAAVELTLYNKIGSRSVFEESLNHLPASSDQDGSTLTLPLSELGSGARGARVVTVPVTTSACGAPRTMDMLCNPQSSGPSGVYPLVVSLVSSSGGTLLGRFTTYLTYTGTSVGQPLRVAFVLPMSAPVVIRHRPVAPGTAIGPSPPVSLTAIRELVTSLFRFSGVPVTLQLSPQTLQGLDRSTALALAELSSNQEVHQVPAASYVPVDLSSLAASGETTEIDGQMRAGAAVLKQLNIATTPGTWVADTPVGSSVGAGLGQVAQTLNEGTVRLVLPESSLVFPQSAACPSLTPAYTWTCPFSLNVGRAQPVEAAESDTHLTAEFGGSPGDPALEAQQLLADLAVVQSEAPYLSGPRGVVAIPPAGWTPTQGFDQELLSGLSNDPVVQAVTLDNFFAQVAPFTPTSAASTAPHLSSGGSALPRGFAHQISTARIHLTGWDDAVDKTPKGQAVLTELDQLLLASESSQLTASEQRDGVSTFDRALDSQLQLIQISSERTITLTARNGQVPVTLLSSAPYPVRGILTLQSPKLIFPGKASQSLLLDRSTNSIRIPVEVRTSGDLPVTATFSSPGNRLTITRAQMTIRSTATSLVGIILTVAAVAVLLGWWARSVVNGRRRRRAAAASREAHR